MGSIRPIVLALCVLGLASRAHADGPYEGQWREGEMSIDVAVESWGGDCGPRPQGTTAPGGGTFRISQSGDQLTFHLRRERTTGGCWSENRAVRRVSSSSQAGTWRIVCRTPPSDSRGETGTYTIQALGNDRLSFRDISRYDWQLNESRCVATITTTQAFSRVGQAPTETTPTPTPTPTEEPEARPSCTAGAAARVVLRPAEADVPPNGEQCFSARVVDAQGCALRTRVELSLADGSGRIEGRCFHAPATEGRAQILARAGDLTATATIAVRTMDLSEWIARRSETGSVGSGAPDEDATAQTAARVSARQPDAVDWTWPIVAVAFALLLVVTAIVMLARRRSSKPSIGGLPGVSIPDAEPVKRPSSTRLAAVPKGEDLICPTCRRGYPPGTDTCSHDGTPLVPYREFTAAKAENVCPTCGTKYPAHVKFCGKDGTTLGPPSA